MAIPRCKLVDPSVTRWYHCISGCVQGAFLLKDGLAGERKAWIENRLEYLSSIFAVSVGGYAILDNHLHLLLRLDPEVLSHWSDEEVLDRWLQLHPPKGSNRKPLPADKLQAFRQKQLADRQRMRELRERLGSLSWFSKCLKEPLARMINKAEKRRGTFFEGRFKSIAVLDEEALLTVCAYIDLNPIAAGLAGTPETSRYTSVKARIAHVQRLGRVADVAAVRQGSVAASQRAEALEESLWLIPIEDRRLLDSSREGIFEGFTLGNYLQLVEYTGRLVREGKASISAEVADIFQRLGSSAEVWHERIGSLSGGRLLGRFLASSRERLDAVAQQLGLSRAANVVSVPTA